MKRARSSAKTSRRRAKAKQAAKGPCKVPSKFTEIESYLEKEGWRKDILTRQIEGAFCNIGVSFLRLRPYFDLLIKAAEIFKNAIGLLSYSKLDGLISVALFGRAAGCFFGAVRLSCSGQLTETWALLRACLENSLYAFYILGNPKLAKVWSERHKSETHKKQCRDAFTIKNIWSALEAKSRSIAKEAKDFYDRTIDWGAHPNERSLFPNLQEKQGGSGYKLSIFNPDPTFMRASLVTIALTASLVFRIFALIFPDEFKQPNLALKISNLCNQTKPLLHVVSDRLRPNKESPIEETR